jgi:signal transduction histidine kinase
MRSWSGRWRTSGAFVSKLMKISPASRLLVNLALNAAEAMDSCGTIIIETTTTAKARQPGSYVRLRVTDQGKGMDQATRVRAFDPFFTTKPFGRGCGLGLSTAWGIARAHAGTIELDSAVGEGTVATVWLPLAPAAGRTP